MSLMRSAVMILFLSTVGCASTVIDAFDESTVNADATATIRIAPGLVVDAVDGNSKWKGSSTTDRPLTVRLPSGTHTLTLRFRQEGGTDQKIGYEFTTTESEPFDFEIHVRAGRLYSIGFRDSGNGWRPIFREIDGSG